MPLRRGSTLALAYNLAHLGHDLVFSVARFHTEWASAVLQREVFKRLTLVAMPFASRRKNQRFEDGPTVQYILARKPSSVSVDFTDYPSLATNPGKRPTVFHEGGAQDMVRPFRLRSLYKDSRFPITIGHHGLVPSSTLNTFGLDLLACDSRPYDRIICTSRSARSIIENTIRYTHEKLVDRRGDAPLFQGRCEVLALGVDTNEFVPRPKQPLRERFGLPPEAVVVLWFGRFDFVQKTNLLPLLQVFRNVVEDSPGVPLLLVVAGNKGPAREEILFQRFAAELGLAQHVYRLTETRPEDDPALHAMADVFVCPSDSMTENFGIAPVQAMACGVPQVVSDWDGHRDTVVHERTGFLVPTHWGANGSMLSRWATVVHGPTLLPALAETTAVDVRALRTYLGTLVRNDILRKTMGEHSRQRAVSMYSLDHIVSQYLALWGELVDQARRDRGAARPLQRTIAPVLDLYRSQVTNVLGADAIFSTTDAGMRVLSGTEAAPLANLEPTMIQPEIAWQILGLLALQPCAAGAVVRAMGGRKHRYPADVVWSHLMWLLKYGYVEVQPSGKTP